MGKSNGSLYAGETVEGHSMQDNALDAKMKGRLDIRRGEKNTRAKWTEDQIKTVRELYAQGISRRKLRLRFPEIPYGTLDGFIYDQSWKHLL